MKSRMHLILPLVMLLMGMSLAQTPRQPAPGENDDAVGRQLIAWSQLQKPQPVPQRPDPIPPPDSQSGQQPSSPTQTQPQQDPSKPGPNAQAQDQESTASTLTGTIAKSGDKYVLQTRDKAVYQLDDQEQAKQYNGKQVKVTGTLDRITGMIHVRNIELLS
jgi:hypothetical protein